MKPSSLPGGPGFGGGPGGRGRGRGAETNVGARLGGEPNRGRARGNSIELDPLIGLNDATKPLRSNFSRSPALRARYLSCVRGDCEAWLDWNKLGPVQQYQSLIAAEVKPTRKWIPPSPSSRAPPTWPRRKVRVRQISEEFCGTAAGLSPEPSGGESREARRIFPDPRWFNPGIVTRSDDLASGLTTV